MKQGIILPSVAYLMKWRCCNRIFNSLKIKNFEEIRKSPPNLTNLSYLDGKATKKADFGN